MHLPVARSAPAVAALGINHDCACQFAGCGIETQRALLQMKRSVHRVQTVPEGETHSGTLGVELECHILRSCTTSYRRKDRNCPKKRRQRPAKRFKVFPRSPERQLNT